MSLANIKANISSELTYFDQYFKQNLSTKVSLLDIVLRYIIQSKGKQIRPLFILLSAKLFGPIQPAAYIACSLIEYIHTATLIHDDVVDEAPLRRGFFSINAKWKNKIAVLVGDFLLSKGLLLAIEKGEFTLLKHISIVVREMSEGELLQIEKAKQLNITEEIYETIIRKKTAVLIAACCASGASAAGQSLDIVQKMWDFGENVGMAFQIKDDLLDYQTGTGKTPYNDLQQRKMTLPLIFSLKQTGIIERFQILRLIKKKRKDKTDIQKLLAFIDEKKGMEYTKEKMLSYIKNATHLLDFLPESGEKNTLLELVNFVIERKL